VGHFGTSSSGVPYQGPFGKSTAGINLSQIYLGWHPVTWFEHHCRQNAEPHLQHAHGLDGDINPEGVAERFKYTVGDADLFANFGQFPLPGCQSHALVLVSHAQYSARSEYRHPVPASPGRPA